MRIVVETCSKLHATVEVAPEAPYIVRSCPAASAAQPWLNSLCPLIRPPFKSTVSTDSSTTAVTAPKAPSPSCATTTSSSSASASSSGSRRLSRQLLLTRVLLCCRSSLANRVLTVPRPCRSESSPLLSHRRSQGYHSLQAFPCPRPLFPHRLLPSQALLPFPRPGRAFRLSRR